jgi:hypothetical protein
MSNPADFQTVVNGQIRADTLLAVLQRWDETREFMIRFWCDNPNMAKQGGKKVLDLIEPIDQVQKRNSAYW